MLTIKQKLQSQRGASMLMAMVFLMFCLLIGGSVLAAATANSSRIEHLVNDQQTFLSQRSALMTMEEMLTTRSGDGPTIIVTESSAMGPWGPYRTIKFAPFNAYPGGGSSTSMMQKILYEVVINNFPRNGAIADHSQFGWIRNGYTFAPKEGSINIEGSSLLSSEKLVAYYTIATDSDYTLTVSFGEDSFVSLVMKGTIATHTQGYTKTTTISWSAPEIQKGDA